MLNLCPSLLSNKIIVELRIISISSVRGNVIQLLEGVKNYITMYNQNDLIDQVLAHYEELDNYIKGEIPLKSFWTIASEMD